MPTETWDSQVSSHTWGYQKDWVYGTGPDVPITDWKSRRVGGQLTRSHPKINGVYLEGGFWHKAESVSERYSVTDAVHAFRPGDFSGKPAYSGQFYQRSFPAAGSDYYVPSLKDGTQNPAFKHGADAWAHARDRLTNPDFSPLLPIVELRELPILLKSSFKDIIKNVFHPSNRKQLKSIGEMNLAYQFGWKPLWKDTQAFLIAQKGNEKRVEQLIRDNGRPVRRRGTLFDKNITTEPNFIARGAPSSAPTLVSQCYANEGWSYTWKRVQDRAWYSGRFRYFLPDGPRNTPKYKKRLRRALYSDFSITPSLAYNLIPWSWLVDYFTDLGVFFDAVSQGLEERLIADYFYVMRDTKVADERESWFDVYINPKGTATTRVRTRALFGNHQKSRAHASPFGFGLSESDLSPTQLGILASLGLSKL